MERDVAELGLKYGLANWQVKWSLLVRDFDPLDPGSTGYLFPIDIWYPAARLISTRLYDCEEITLGTLGAQVGMFLELDTSPNDQTETSQDGLGRFRVKIEIPIECPPDLMVHYGRIALSNARKLVRSIGVPVSERVGTDACSAKKIRTYLAAHDLKDPFIAKLETVCDENGIAFEGDPTFVANPYQSRMSPFALVRLVVEAPIDVKSETLARAVRQTIRTSREVLKVAGLDLGERLRTSPLMKKAVELSLDGTPLSPRALGDLVERHYDITPRVDGKPNPEGQRLSRQMKSRRHFAGNRLRRKLLSISDDPQDRLSGHGHVEPDEEDSRE